MAKKCIVSTKIIISNVYLVNNKLMLFVLLLFSDCYYLTNYIEPEKNMTNRYDVTYPLV